MSKVMKSFFVEVACLLCLFCDIVFYVAVDSLIVLLYF